MVRSYHKEHGHSFNDWEKASLIWNALFYRRDDILMSLGELASETADIDLKNQIEERLSYEQKKLDVFKINENNDYVYIVYDSERKVHGFYHCYEQAWECALRFRVDEEMRAYYEDDEDNTSTLSFQFSNYGSEIEKRYIGSKDKAPFSLKYTKEDLPKVLNSDKMDEPADNEKENGGVVSRVEIDGMGKLKWVASAELAYAKEFKEEYKGLFGEGRFENLNVRIPYPNWYATKCVRNLVSGELGYVYPDSEPRDCYNSIGEKEIKACFIGKDGFWRTSYVSPYILESGYPDPEEGAQTEEIYAIYAIENWMHQLPEGWFLEACAQNKEYFEKLQDEKEKERVVAETEENLIERSQAYSKHYGKLRKVHNVTDPYKMLVYGWEEDNNEDDEDEE